MPNKCAFLEKGNGSERKQEGSERPGGGQRHTEIVVPTIYPELTVGQAS